MRRLVAAALALGAYEGLVRGAVTLDLGIGRRVQPLGPRTWLLPAPRERVFELVAAAYAERRPRALQAKVEIWERGEDMVLAAHRTRVGRRTVVTVETVRLEPPALIAFRLVRGPVPHVAETFELEEADGGATLTWRGELGTDLGPVGAFWGRRVAAAWEAAVAASIAEVRHHL